MHFNIFFLIILLSTSLLTITNIVDVSREPITFMQNALAQEEESS